MGIFWFKTRQEQVILALYRCSAVYLELGGGGTMNFPAKFEPNIRQFSNDPNDFWDKFVAANPAPTGLTEDSEHIWQEQLFARRYSYSFANILGAGHAHDPYNLPVDIKRFILICMLTPSAP